MIHVAICEDDQTYIDNIQEYLSRYAQETGQAVVPTVFYDGEDLIEDYEQKYDIILMDIEMASIDGMTAAAEVRKVDTQVIIIFITNTPQYAMEGYKVNALDYVLKPINYFALSQRIDRAMKYINNRSKAFLNVQANGTVRRIDISRIQYIEVQNHNVLFHTLDDCLETKDSLKNLEGTLAAHGFFRCHKWFLVNLEHVVQCKQFDILVGETTIQVSRSRKKDFMDALNNYINSGRQRLVV